MRPETKYEEFFRYIAQELDEPGLCEKISWTAILPGGFFEDQSYMRSECYEYIAGRTRNPWLCWRVKRYGSFSLLSHQTSMWSCLDYAIHGWNGGIGINPDDLPGFFKEMGYDPDTLHLEGEVVELVPSRSKPQGVARVKWTLYNQKGEAVYTFNPIAIVPSRPK